MTQIIDRDNNNMMNHDCAVNDNDITDRKGVALELDSHAAQELRQRDAERRRQRQRNRKSDDENSAEHSTNDSGITDDAPYSDAELILPGDNVNDGNEDDWNEILMLPPHLQTKNAEDEDETNEDNSNHSQSNNHDNANSQEPNNNNNHNHENDDASQSSQETAVSLTPPDSLPVVHIHLERLLGYCPATRQEGLDLRPQIQEAVWGRNVGGGDVDEKNDEDDENTATLFCSQELELRLSELFDTDAARHGERKANDGGNNNTTEATLQTNEGGGEDSKNSITSNLAWLSLDYPPLFCPQQSRNHDHQDEAEIQIYRTEHCWKILLQSHAIPVVERLLALLRNCNQCLSYKRQLRREIVCLARREERRQTQYKREQELYQWKAFQRKDQLDQLYSVQETLQHRLDMAQVKLAQLTKERDETVQDNLRRQRLATGQDVGVDAFDFASTMFSFPTGTFLGGDLMDNENDPNDDDDYCLLSEADDLQHDDNDSYYTSSEDASSMADDGDDEREEMAERDGEVSANVVIVVGETKASGDDDDEDDDVAATNTAAPSRFKSRSRHHPRPNKKARRKAAELKKKRLEYAAKEAEHEQKLAIAQEEEAIMRDACTTEELKVTHAFVKTLQDRLDKVDELIETLQEEVWEDEEEGVVPPEKHPDAEQEHDGVSLLDQILAMILGSTPPPLGKDMVSHVKWLQNQHSSIVTDWKGQFGRLPPALALGGEAIEDDSSSRHGDDTAMMPNNQFDESKEQDASLIGPVQSADEMRKSLGIGNLKTENWDIEEDEEEEGSETPGGRIG